MRSLTLFGALVLVCLVCAIIPSISACRYSAGGKEFDLSSLKGQIFTGSDVMAHQFSLSFCDDLGEACGNKPYSICYKPTGMGNPVSYASNTLKPEPTTAAPGNGDNFAIDIIYHNSEQNCKATTRTTHLRLICSDENDTSFNVADDLDNDCTYFLEFHTPAVCKSAGGLSGGAIFLIIFFSVFVAYFVIGALLLKFLWKKEGLDIIPNRTFWTALPGFFAAGISVAIAKIKACTNKKGGDASGDSGAGYDTFTDGV